MVPVSFAEMDFAGHEWRLGAGRWLYWPAESALLVADLHLEKASWFAARGQMLPPYDSRETLERLALAIGLTGARRVFCLGDNFHDSAGPQRMEPHAAGMLAALTRATDWVWITGNHDPLLDAAAGGTQANELIVGGVVLRHRAERATLLPEISGHYHPKVAVSLRGRRLVRPCVVAADGQEHGGAGRLIMPAFGSLTGGMDAAAPEILAAVQPARAVDACIAAADRLVRLPLWRAAA